MARINADNRYTVQVQTVYSLCHGAQLKNTAGDKYTMYVFGLLFTAKINQREIMFCLVIGRAEMIR
jgi:hypothetical protein